MLVKHSITGLKVERDDCFIVKQGTRNLFFDNQEQYIDWLKDKELKKTLATTYITLMTKYVDITFAKNIIPRMRRDVKLMMEAYPYDYLDGMLKKENKSLLYAHESKSFVTPMAKYGYLFKIITNQLAEGLRSWEIGNMSKVSNDNVSTTVMELVSKNKGFKNEDISQFVKEEF